MKAAAVEPAPGNTPIIVPMNDDFSSCFQRLPISAREGSFIRPHLTGLSSSVRVMASTRASTSAMANAPTTTGINVIPDMSGYQS